MTFPHPRFSLRQMMAGVGIMAAALAGVQALLRQEGSPSLGLVTVAACLGWLTVVAAASPGVRTPLRPLALAVVLIGVPDVAFLAYYWCRCGGNWSVVLELHGPRELYLRGVVEAAAVALLVASLLRRALWPGDVRRPARICSLAAAGLILAVLLAGSWLVPRHTYYLAQARYHEMLEGHYGGASWAVVSKDLPPGAARAAYHGRMRRRCERVARYPWLRIAPDPPEP